MNKISRLWAAVIGITLCTAAHGAVRTVFSSSGDAPAEILAQLHAATGTIRVAMYGFTDQRLAAALTNAAARGVDVRVIADRVQASGKTSCVPMLERTLGTNRVLRTSGRHGTGIMHLKVCVIDGHTVLSGSYNWTTRADADNWEVFDIITDAGVAANYTQEWSRISGTGLTAPPRHVYGWRRDTPSKLDKLYALPGVPVTLPTSTDLRTNCPPVYDQGQLGSCTANAIAAAWDFENHLQKFPWLTPSRLFIYYCERALEGTVGEDAGAQIRDGLTVVTQQGVCAETLWPYNIAKFTVKPPPPCYTAARADLVLQNQRLAQNLTTMKTVLAQGHPFVFGFTVYNSFESAAVASTGLVPMPQPNEDVLGGHAVLAVGYSDSFKINQPTGPPTIGAILARNSWGPCWGLSGYFWIPYSYVLNPNLASDFWAILKVE